MNLYEDDSDADEVRRAENAMRASGSSQVATGDVEREQVGAVFHWLDQRNPVRARRRFGRLYWNGWSRLVMSFFLSAFGVTFLIIGLLCMYHCDDFDRGVAFFFIGLLLFMPGMYGTVTLLYYLQGYRGYSYKDLPDMN